MLPEYHECQFPCLLYTSDAADDLLCVDLGGTRNTQKKKKKTIMSGDTNKTQDEEVNHKKPN